MAGSQLHHQLLSGDGEQHSLVVERIWHWGKKQGHSQLFRFSSSSKVMAGNNVPVSMEFGDNDEQSLPPTHVCNSA